MVRWLDTVQCQMLGISFAQCYLVLRRISEENSAASTRYSIIWDWLNLSLLEAAVFITVIVLLCCYFTLEEYSGRFWRSYVCMLSVALNCDLCCPDLWDIFISSAN